MAFSSRRMRAEDWARIRNFKPEEFKHPDMMGLEFIVWLDSLRDYAGVPIHISSDYRSPEHNAAVGGASDSAHMDVPCNSIDIRMAPTPADPNWNYARYRILFGAYELGCRRFGTYSDGSLHIDRTEDSRPAPRVWVVVNGHP